MHSADSVNAILSSGIKILCEAMKGLERKILNKRNLTPLDLAGHSLYCFFPAFCCI